MPSNQPNTPELPHLASHCSGTNLFSLSKYKKEDEAVECLDNWVKQGSWVLGLGFQEMRFSLPLFSVCDCLCVAYIYMCWWEMWYRVRLKPIKKKCKLWSYLASSHPSFKSSTLSFRQSHQEMFSWVISGNISLLTFTSSSFGSYLHSHQQMHLNSCHHTSYFVTEMQGGLFYLIPLSFLLV